MAPAATCSTRIFYAGRISLSVGLVSVSISMLIGIIIGSIAGYKGGKVDMFLMRLTDMFMTFPSLVIIITVAAAMGPSVYNAMLVIGLLTWPSIARLVRGQFLTLREQQFVRAARSIGVSDWEIVFKHIFPNTISSIAVAVTFGVANAILLEASLSFLGLGVQAPTPSWGNMLRDAQSLNILEGMPWMWLPPGLMIGLGGVEHQLHRRRPARRARPAIDFVDEATDMQRLRMRPERHHRLQPAQMSRSRSTVQSA